MSLRPSQIWSLLQTCRMMQILEDGCQELREQLLLRHDLTMHAHYLRQGPISVHLLAALRLAVGDEQYLRAVEQRVSSPLQVRESLRELATSVLALWERYAMMCSPLGAGSARVDHAAGTS